MLLAQDGSLGNETHMLAVELLLELTNQTALNLLKSFVLAIRDENDNSLLVAHINLFHRSNHQIFEVTAQVLGGVF